MTLSTQLMLAFMFCTLIQFVQSQNDICASESNLQRSRNGLRPLKTNENLIRAAKAHNDWMIRHNCFQYRCPGEPDIGGRATQAGYKWRNIAQNSRAGYDEDCGGAVNNWARTAGKKHLLGDYTHIGCAKSVCNDCDYKNYYTCMYGRPR